jgi:hypothetical protein
MGLRRIYCSPANGAEEKGWPAWERTKLTGKRSHLTFAAIKMYL